MIYLNKILPILLSPIFLVLLMMVVGVWRNSLRLIIFAGLVLFLLSTPIVGGVLYSMLERGMVRKTPDSVSVANAIVVLSNGIVSTPTEDGFYSEWSDPDRFFGGVQLIKAQKSKRLIFTQGKLPWSGNTRPVGEVWRETALEMGVDAAKVSLTGLVENTEQEAIESAKLFSSEQDRNIILVTSAFHMSRAKLIFESKGFSVQTYPVDFNAHFCNKKPATLLPSAFALNCSSNFVREVLGRIFYRLRGLIWN